MIDVHVCVYLCVCDFCGSGNLIPVYLHVQKTFLPSVTCDLIIEKQGQTNSSTL